MKKYLYFLAVVCMMLVGMCSCYAEMAMPEPGVYTRSGEGEEGGTLYIYQNPKGLTFFEVRVGMPPTIFAGTVKREGNKISACMEAKSHIEEDDKVKMKEGMFINEWVCPVAVGKLKYYLTTEDDIIDLGILSDECSTTTIGRPEVAGRYIRKEASQHQAGPIVAAYIAERYADANAADWEFGYLEGKPNPDKVNTIWLKSYDAKEKEKDFYLVTDDLTIVLKNGKRIW